MEEHLNLKHWTGYQGRPMDMNWKMYIFDCERTDGTKQLTPNNGGKYKDAFPATSDRDITRKNSFCMTGHMGVPHGWSNIFSTPLHQTRFPYRRRDSR